MEKYGLIGTGKRKRIEINKQNFYLIVTGDSVTCTVPHENRPEQKELRNIVDTLCAEISELMVLNGG